MEDTKRKNINRGYMKLEVWNDAIFLFQMVDDVGDWKTGIVE